MRKVTNTQIEAGERLPDDGRVTQIAARCFEEQWLKDRKRGCTLSEVREREAEPAFHGLTLAFTMGAVNPI